MSEKISDERLRNTHAWATARRGELSGAEVIVGAIDELLQLRAERVCAHARLEVRGDGLETCLDCGRTRQRTRATTRTIDHVTECYIFADSGYVNTCRPGQVRNSQHPYETATVTLNVGQRMIVERVDQGRMRLEVLP